MQVMKRSRFSAVLYIGVALLIGAALALAWAATATAPATSGSPSALVTVYKTPQCGCCTAWVDYMRDEGFDVEAHDVGQQELNAIKQEAGLQRKLASCHTAFVEGYVVEGHVPAEDVRRLLADRPEVDGIAVPGMPIGSPGMEMGNRRDAYEVFTFANGEKMDAFASHNQ
ncbi:DUF411 domain-containing protein [Aquisalimonas sp.]|uniref:DUF411 domain-containing protein n=1 Tax=Aquisalimonas sp. TaxID=1872621 RepID=UPI0025B80494|nr:DUF411 domain-containing protein [Aquisalimonas sp.]